MFEVDSTIFGLIIISSRRDAKYHLKRNVHAPVQRKLDYNLAKRAKPLQAKSIEKTNFLQIFAHYQSVGTGKND